MVDQEEGLSATTLVEFPSRSERGSVGPDIGEHVFCGGFGRMCIPNSDHVLVFDKGGKNICQRFANCIQLSSG